ncbi:MAG: VWA domain-containing protein [Vicinamibacterales bacterium]
MRPNVLVPVGMSLLAWCSAATWLVAQQPSSPQPRVFRGAVDLVQMQAVVVDDHGDPVNGLTQADFQIFDRGRAQSIATFAEVSYAPSAGPTFPPLLVRDVADNTLAAKAERVVVILVDDLHVLAPKPAVASVVHRLVGLIAPPVSIALVSTSGRIAVEPTEDLGVIHRALAAYASAARPEAPSATMTAMGKLMTVSTALAAETLRRKVCVVVSSRWNLEAAAEDELTPEIARSALAALLRANLTTYVLDPSWDTGAFPPMSGLAAATGGFAAGADWLETGMTRLVEDLNHYYLLGFYPEGPADGKPRELEVRVTRPGVNVRSRRSYVQGGPIAREKGNTPLMDLAWNPLPVTNLPLQLFAAPYFTTEGRTRVAVAIQVAMDREPSPSASGAFADWVDFGLMAIQAGHEKASLKVEHHAPVAVPAPYQILTSVALDPGRYQLRASVISSTLGKGGSVYLSIDVPDPQAGDVTLGGIVIGLDGRALVPVADQSSLANLTLPFAPALDRTFSADDTLRVYFQIARRRATTPVAGTLAVINVADGLVTSLPWQVGANAAPAVDLRVPLSGLAPGPYRLINNVSDTLPSARTQQQVGFVVR